MTDTNSQLKIPKLLNEKVDKFEREFNNAILNIGKYAQENGFNILILLLRKSYSFVEHSEVYKTLEKEYGLKIFSDVEFKNELLIKLNENQSIEEIKKWKMIIFDDAINEGENISKFFDDISEIIMENYEKPQKTWQSLPHILEGQKGESPKLIISSRDFIRDLVRRGNIKITAFLINADNSEWKGRLAEQWGDELLSLCGNFCRSEQKQDFIINVAKIIDFLAHTGEIIDPDHLKIDGMFNQSLSYETIWDILNDITDGISGSIYEPDIKYYHPNKKKITIYNLPCKDWIKKDIQKIGLYSNEFQCKIRFIFFLENNESMKFYIVPIINPKIIQGKISRCKYSEIEHKFCEYCDNEMLYKYMCQDCVLFEVTTIILKSFFGEYFLKSSIKDKLKSMNPSWKFLYRRYQGTRIPKFVRDSLRNILQE